MEDEEEQQQQEQSSLRQSAISLMVTEHHLAADAKMRLELAEQEKKAWRPSDQEYRLTQPRAFHEEIPRSAGARGQADQQSQPKLAAEDNLTDYLGHLQARYRCIDAIYVVDPTGVIIAHTNVRSKYLWLDYGSVVRGLYCVDRNVDTLQRYLPKPVRRMQSTVLRGPSNNFVVTHIFNVPMAIIFILYIRETCPSSEGVLPAEPLPYQHNKSVSSPASAVCLALALRNELSHIYSHALGLLSFALKNRAENGQKPAANNDEKNRGKDKRQQAKK